MNWRRGASVPQAVRRTSWMSVWVAFSGGGGVQHPSPRRSGNVVGVCLGGIRCSGSPRTSWVSVWVACNGAAEEELPSTKQSENVVEVCLGGIHRRWRSAASVAQVRKRRGCLGWHSLLRQSENVVGVCLGGCNGVAEEELPSTKQSENVVDVCLGCIHRRWRSAASVAQAVRKRRGCLSGWHSLLRQSENVVGVCLGGMQWSCRRGASVDQAV